MGDIPTAEEQEAKMAERKSEQDAEREERRKLLKQGKYAAEETD